MLSLATLALLEGSDVTMRLSAADLARADDAKGSLPLDMHGFSDALAKLRRSCDAAVNKWEGRGATGETGSSL